MNIKLIVIGGVAGGAAAATRARRLSEKAEIILFERGFHVSYANCGLPYFIGGEIEDRDDLFISSPQRLQDRYRIDVRVQQEVVKILPDRKIITGYDHASGKSFFESYDKLILSPGAFAMTPDLPGRDLPFIFTLRDLPDSDSIKAHLDRNAVEKAVVVGGGSIGLEALENFSRLGISVSLIEQKHQVLPGLDYDMAARVHRELRDQEIDLCLGECVTEFTPADRGVNVKTQKGRELRSDLVLLAVGVRPEKELAVNAGLTIGSHGGILVNNHLQTSDPDIYAVGDVVEVKDLVTGNPGLLALAGPANRQARTAADNIMGRDTVFDPVLGTAITRIFNLTAGNTGAGEEALTRAGLPFQVSFTHSFHHASYYPDARPMAVKLLFQEDGTLLGGQIVGEKGVDKRIDILATAIRAKMTVHDLERLELAYAPQFGSARDVVNIAGSVAANILKGDVETISWRRIRELDTSTHTLLDVRSANEVRASGGTIPGAVHIHVDALRDNLHKLDRNKMIIPYCTVSQRGYVAYRILVQNGFRARILSGGMETWEPPTEDLAEQGC